MRTIEEIEAEQKEVEKVKTYIRTILDSFFSRVNELELELREIEDATSDYMRRWERHRLKQIELAEEKECVLEEGKMNLGGEDERKK